MNQIGEAYTDNRDFSYSSVHLNHRMFGLDSYQGHMSLSYKHVMDVCLHAFSDTLCEDKKRKKMASALVVKKPSHEAFTSFYVWRFS